MDAGFELPWMGSRHVFGSDTQFMSRCQCMRIKPLFTTDINRKYLAETRPMLIKLGPSVGARHPHPTTTDGGSAGFAYVHGWTVVGQRICTGCTVLGQCRSYCRGAVVEEQKTCHTADGLSKVLPVYFSRYYLWDSSVKLSGSHRHISIYLQNYQYLSDRD